MCFHASVTHRTEKIEKTFSVGLFDENIRSLFDKPQYHLNGFAHPNMLVIPQEKKQVLAPAVWGLVPSNKTASQIPTYYKEALKFGSGLNARSEKLFQHALYKESVLNRRCLIPITGFFEPHEYNKKKYPFYIQNSFKEPLALAGLYSVIETHITFTILTKAASPKLEQIHNSKKRQPVILNLQDVDSWLSNQLTPLDIIELIHTNYPDTFLETYPVSKDLFRSQVDSNQASILEQVSYPELGGYGTLF
jgi:putative SOS response-associated peptidase YedK